MDIQVKPEGTYFVVSIIYVLYLVICVTFRLIASCSIIQNMESEINVSYNIHNLFLEYIFEYFKFLYQKVMYNILSIVFCQRELQTDLAHFHS